MWGQIRGITEQAEDRLRLKVFRYVSQRAEALAQSLERLRK